MPVYRVAMQSPQYHSHSMPTTCHVGIGFLRTYTADMYPVSQESVNELRANRVRHENKRKKFLLGGVGTEGVKPTSRSTEGCGRISR